MFKTYHNSHLTAEVVKRSCAFTLHINSPMETLERLSKFFKERHVMIDTMQMHRYRDGEAMLIIHCQVEKDRILRTIQLMEQMPGIMKLEKMEGK